MLLNEKPLKLEDDGRTVILEFFATTYADGQLAIVAETDEAEPWAVISINLSGYGMYPPRGCIFLSHDLSSSLKQLVVDEFGKETFPIRYGYATSIGIILKDEIKNKINELQKY